MAIMHSTSARRLAIHTADERQRLSARSKSRRELIQHHCQRSDLSTYDPYDIWTTSWGLKVKESFHCRRLVGLIPAAVLQMFDFYANNRQRRFYQRREQPVVRSLAALSLLNLNRVSPDDRLLRHSECHLDWLAEHAVSSGHGLGWGLPFEHIVSPSVRYAAHTPLSTLTPYGAEAFLEYQAQTKCTAYDPLLKAVFRFFDEDLVLMRVERDSMATSYAAFRDRTVINAVSYTMYALAALRPFADVERVAATTQKIGKLYQFLMQQQRQDGAWYYSPEPNAFIDCFHSCFVIKNLIKTNRLVSLPEAGRVAGLGYEFLKRTLFDRRHQLFRRFAVRNKPGLVRFDLYDNSEMLNLALLLDDRDFARRLAETISRRFVRGLDIDSQIDWLGIRRNQNMLRWSVMPYLYALSVAERQRAGQPVQTDETSGSSRDLGVPQRSFR